MHTPDTNDDRDTKLVYTCWHMTETCDVIHTYSYVPKANAKYLVTFWVETIWNKAALDTSNEPQTFWTIWRLSPAFRGRQTWISPHHLFLYLWQSHRKGGNHNGKLWMCTRHSTKCCQRNKGHRSLSLQWLHGPNVSRTLQCTLMGFSNPFECFFSKLLHFLPLRTIITFSTYVGSECAFTITNIWYISLHIQSIYKYIYIQFTAVSTNINRLRTTSMAAAKAWVCTKLRRRTLGVAL